MWGCGAVGVWSSGGVEQWGCGGGGDMCDVCATPPGAVYQAAGHTKLFRVKKFVVKEGSVYPIQVILCILTLSHPHTITPSHPHTLRVTPSHPQIVTPSQSHPHTLSHTLTVTPSHPHTLAGIVLSRGGGWEGGKDGSANSLPAQQPLPSEEGVDLQSL